jgi:hypothetical protein
VAKNTPAKEKDYSQRDVLDKLGIKLGQVGALVSQTEAPFDEMLYQKILTRLTLSPTDDSTIKLNVVLVQIDTNSDAVAILREWRPRIEAAGSIWLLSPKRTQEGYVDQRDLIVAGQQAGVVDNKICSVSDTISAMRFVIRKADRP